MTSVAFQAARASRDCRKLIGRHRLQIDSQPQPRELTQVLAITFRPGPESASFREGTARKLGTTALIAMTYSEGGFAGDRLSMPICAYQAKAATDGSVIYGGESRCLFSHDGARVRPYRGGKGAINVFRNPSIVETVLMLDRICKKQLRKYATLRSVPRLPRVLLGFSPDDLPQFEDTLALRRLAAQKLEIPVERLGGNGAVLLDRLLRDLWEQQWVPATKMGVRGELLLIDADYCTQAWGALTLFEDFSQLLGVRTWNPATRWEFPHFDNPAHDVLRRFEVDVHQDFNQFFPDELIERFEQAMRSAVGAAQSIFTSEEILDGLTNPSRPLVSYASQLPMLRARLSGEISECCTDEDLLRAARESTEPLFASYACQVQVLRRSASSSATDVGAIPGRRGIDLMSGLRSACTVECVQAAR